MPESSLTLKRSDFMTKTATFLGWGRGEAYGETAWTDFQKALLQEFVDSACRQFYVPVLEGGSSYDWSFLKPVVSATLAADASTLPLPDDFGGIEGRITLTAASTDLWEGIPLMNEGQLREKYMQFPNQSGRPQWAAVVPLKGIFGTHGQRFQLYFWPTADQAYTLQFAYYLLGDALTDQSPYVYGSGAHSETILEGCMAVAEQRLDNVAGLHTALFAQRLQASVNQDRRLKPQTLGYNGDNSDSRDRHYRGRYWSGNPVTFNGISYP